MRALQWARRRVAEGARGDESGASLILALAFLTLFGALLVTLLGFVQAAFLANRRVHAQGERQYAMAGAIDAAVQHARKVPAMGATPGAPSCGDSATSYSGISVSCAPKYPHDGGLAPGPNVLKNAILTTNGGITSSTGTLTVAGPVYANGPIDVAKLDAEDLPITGTSCSNTGAWVYTEPIVACPPVAGTSPPGGVGADPGWNYDIPDAASMPPLRTLTDVTCGGGGYYAYPAGYYSDVAVLMDTAKCPGARARYFAPGTYYFDFSGTTTWAISGLPVIGGTATGWLGGSPPAAPSPSKADAPPAQPTACSGSGPGVRFVFGGASTVSVAQGTRVELCPDPGQVVMYGQRLTNPGAVVSTPTAVSWAQPVCPATVSTTTAPCWRNSDTDPGRTDARVLGVEGLAQRIWGQAVLNEAKTDPSASLTLTGFTPTTLALGTYNVAVSVPNTTSLLDMSVTPPQVDNGYNIGKRKVTLSFTNTSTPPVTCDVTLTSSTGGGKDSGQLLQSADGGTNACLLDVVRSAFSVTYTATLLGTGQADAQMWASLDGVEVKITPKVFPRAQSTTNPVLFLQSGAKFAAWGPVVMGNAAFTVDVSGDVIFNNGVVLKSLVVNGGKADVPAFRLGGGRRTMLLEATESSRRVQALVTVTDYGAPGYWARVRRWNVRK